MSKVSCKAAEKHQGCDFANGAAELLYTVKDNKEYSPERKYSLLPADKICTPLMIFEKNYIFQEKRIFSVMLSFKIPASEPLSPLATRVAR